MKRRSPNRNGTGKRSQRGEAPEAGQLREREFWLAVGFYSWDNMTSSCNEALMRLAKGLY